MNIVPVLLSILLLTLVLTDRDQPRPADLRNNSCDTTPRVNTRTYMQRTVARIICTRAAVPCSEFTADPATNGGLQSSTARINIVLIADKKKDAAIGVKQGLNVLANGRYSAPSSDRPRSANYARLTRARQAQDGRQQGLRHPGQVRVHHARGLQAPRRRQTHSRGPQFAVLFGASTRYPHLIYIPIYHTRPSAY